MSTYRRTVHTLALTVLPVVALSGCYGITHPEEFGTEAPPLPEVTSNMVELREHGFRHLWPFTVATVRAHCEEQQQLIITAPDGTEYGFNDKAQEAGYPASDPILNGESTGSVFGYAFQTCSN